MLLAIKRDIFKNLLRELIQKELDDRIRLLVILPVLKKANIVDLIGVANTMKTVKC